MLSIHKKIVTDEAMQPIAVQIDYADWLKIEQQLSVLAQGDKHSRIAKLQARVRRYIPAERSLADELITERREAARHE